MESSEAPTIFEAHKTLQGMNTSESKLFSRVKTLPALEKISKETRR
jgi:hypothetical protein